MWIFSIINVVHILTCFLLILAVLLQPGKGDGMGSAFGGGASSSVFGGRGATTVLGKLTWVLAITFMLTSISLAWKASKTDSSGLKKASKKPKMEQVLFGKKAGSKPGSARPAASGEPGASGIAPMAPRAMGLPPKPGAPAPGEPTPGAPAPGAPMTTLPTTMAPAAMAPATMAPTTMAPAAMAPATMAPTTMAPAAMAPAAMRPVPPARRTPPLMAPPAMRAAAMPPAMQ